MINLKDMTKEQKQRLILGGIVLIAVIFALKQFVITPMMASRTQARADFELLKTKLQQASNAIRNETETLRKLQETKSELTTAQRDFVPSVDNSLAWATKTIYSQARSVGIDIEAVAETDVDVSGFMAKDQAQRAYKPYAVRIMTECGYQQLLELVRTLEEKDPYLCITTIQIQTQPATPERHQVTLVVEWPAWKDPAKAKPYQEEDSDEKS